MIYNEFAVYAKTSGVYRVVIKLTSLGLFSRRPSRDLRPQKSFSAAVCGEDCVTSSPWGEDNKIYVGHSSDDGHFQLIHAINANKYNGLTIKFWQNWPQLKMALDRSYAQKTTTGSAGFEFPASQHWIGGLCFSRRCPTFSRKVRLRGRIFIPRDITEVEID